LGIVGTKVITAWDILRDVKDEMAKRQGILTGVFQEQKRSARAQFQSLSEDQAVAEKELAATEPKIKAAKDKGDATEVARLGKVLTSQRLKLVEMGKNLDKVRGQLAELNNKSVEQMGQMRSSLMRAALAQRIDDQLLVQDLKNKQAEAMKTPTYQPPPGFVDKLVRDFMKKEKKNREQLTLYLRREGIPYEEFQLDLLDKELLRYINNRSRVVVSPRKIRDFYERQKAGRYSLGRAVTLHYLALPADQYPDLKTASEARKTVKALGDLQKLAKDTGVDLKRSMVSEEYKLLARPIVDAAKAMAQGEVELVRVAGMGGKITYFIIIAEKVEKNKVIPLEEVRGQIEAELVGRVYAAKRKRELARIRLTIPNFNIMK